MSEKDDNELVYEVIRGSISSFEVLIDRYQKTIFNMVLKMVGDVETAKDITQDVFVKVFEKMGSFNFKYRFFSWIYRIALNQTLNYLKSNPRKEGLKTAEALPADENREERAEHGNLILRQGLRELPVDYRVLLLLKYYCSMSYEEISETMGIPVKKVRSRLFMAREQLNKVMVAKGFFDND